MTTDDLKKQAEKLKKELEEVNKKIEAKDPNREVKDLLNQLLARIKALESKVDTLPKYLPAPIYVKEYNPYWYFPYTTWNQPTTIIGNQKYQNGWTTTYCSNTIGLDDPQGASIVC